MAQLKQQVELLKKQVEQLRAEVDLLKAKLPGAAKQGAKTGELTDLLTVDRVIPGDYKFTNGTLDKGDYTLTVTERDGAKVKATATVMSRDKKDAKPIEINFEGKVDGTRLTLSSVGSAGKATLTLALKGESLEGTFTTMGGGKGTLGFTLKK